MGKSPLLAHLTVCLTSGMNWCGRVCQKRPVVVIDFENAIWQYIRNIENISKRLGVSCPDVPDYLEAYLEHASGKPESAYLLEVMSSSFDARINFLRERLVAKPTAVVILDPLEVLFELSEKAAINRLYRALRKLLVTFPHAVLLPVYNLRKKSRVAVRMPNLLYDPQDWLEETCGHLNLLNRADVRLGIDRYLGDDHKRIINGVRRGEYCQPIIIHPEGDAPNDLAGFELCYSDELSLENVFTPAQFIYWNMLPKAFKFIEWTGRVKDGKVPKVSLSNLVNKAKSLGILSCNDSTKEWSKHEMA